ncbi:MAG: hypothetical protein AAFP77_01010 [Bacteroidota bacterium]
MKAILPTISLLVFLLSYSACDIINPEEQVPAYLEIEPFTLNTVAGAQGSANARIVEAWVFIDGAFLGVYDLPATVPVLAVGPTDIRIDAGIKENGVNDRPEPYPFYESYEVRLNLEANKTEVIQPTTRYTTNTKFAFIEDFEDIRPRIFTETIFGQTELTRTQSEVFEGNFSGQFSVTREERPLVEISSSVDFSGLQDEGIFVYLEVDYKSDAAVAWGIAGEQNAGSGQLQFYDPGFNPSLEWNKIYFHLSPLIFDAGIEDYKIAFQAFLTESSPDSANVFLDNIKLVHF